VPFWNNFLTTGDYLGFHSKGAQRLKNLQFFKVFIDLRL